MAAAPKIRICCDQSPFLVRYGKKLSSAVDFEIASTPPAVVTWFVDGKELTNQDERFAINQIDDQKCQLKFKNLKYDRTVAVAVVAKNRFGEDKVAFKIATYKGSIPILLYRPTQ